MTEEQNNQQEAVETPVFKTTLTQEQIEAAQRAIRNRPFSVRHPELGKMIKCQVCGLRHRQFDRECTQKFTYRVGDYELYREDENGALVPNYRTAIPADDKPTKRQVNGAAAYAKQRFHPHPSKVKLQFIERVRIVFQELGFDLDNPNKEQFAKDLHRSRVVAARQLRKERRMERKRRRKLGIR